MNKRMPVFFLIMNTMAIASHAINIPLALEDQIPFDIQITDNPTQHCDPLELVVEIKPDNQFRWSVMGDDDVQITFDTFDDLYYTCDGPACFLITFKDSKDGKQWCVCLK